jgi:hypothetical protein
MDSTNGWAAPADPRPRPSEGGVGAEPAVAASTGRAVVVSPQRGTPRWVHLSVGAAGLGLVGSVIALADRRIYAGLTPAFLPQALAQDIANLAIAPLLAVTAVLAGRGAPRARALWLGVIAFTLYNQVIYAFSVPFGPLFLLWVAVLGLSLFALVLGLRDVGRQGGSVAPRLARPTAVFLLAVAGVFALLWLSEDVPALLRGSTPQSLRDLAIPTNPVHVLDYAVVVPAAIVTGVRLLRRDRFAARTAPAFSVFLVLTCVPVLITPFTAGSGAGSAGPVVVVLLVAAVLGTVLALLLRSIRPEPRAH